MTRPEAVQQFEVEAPDSRHEPGAVPVLVVGMGASAYGRERRAVTAFHHMCANTYDKQLRSVNEARPARRFNLIGRID